VARRESIVAEQKAMPFPLDPKTWDEVAAALKLSARQKSMVALLLRGKQDKQISHDLGIKLPTITSYFNRIFHKVGVRNRMELLLRVFVTAREIAPIGRRRQRA
jgi:DNA-binding NarL/FixJ family response regulator